MGSRLRRASALLLVAAALAAAARGGDGGGSDAPAPDLLPMAVASRAPAPRTVGGLELIAAQDGTDLVLHTKGGEVRFWTGVNVGSSVPGHHPAELAVTAEDWRRWFPMIADLGVHAIRIYTVQPPSFYDELLAYNTAHRRRPLYLVHGVWIPEEEAMAARDLFAPGVVDRLEQDIDDAIGVIHGDAVLPDRPGYAVGAYTSDVSPWLISWAFGIELDPELVLASDATNRGVTYDGTFVTPEPSATPTEVWLARMLDRLASGEAARGRSMPLTFSNWPTTDPLEHPLEPLEKEDLVGIDLNNLRATPAWPGGLYASYHAYPYYPDFQRYEPGIADYTYNGVDDAYAGYLVKLRDHHAAAGYPTAILEFGVPSSLGSAHHGSLGRDQGGHSEQEAMAMNAGMLRTQHDLGLAGGFLFAWTDEWFKRTWNTMDLTIPAERRPLWFNPLTNESQFGLLAVQPGESGPNVIVDGDDGEWTADHSQAIHESRGVVREVRVTHDEGYLYLRLVLDHPEAWRDGPISVGFDAVPSVVGDDHRVVIDETGTARAYVRAALDPNALVYGEALGYLAVDPATLDPAAEVWNEQRLIVNRPLLVPGETEANPVEWFALNPLRAGTTDPDAIDFDSEVLWSARGTVVELRLPWMMIGFADPSSRQALVPAGDGSLSTVTVERLGVTVATGDAVEKTAGYAWEDWSRVFWHERLKAGVDGLADAIAEVS